MVKVRKGAGAADPHAVEMAGWDYPKHLSNRVYGLVMHGDVAGIASAWR